jgi:hypothetical protein
MRAGECLAKASRVTEPEADLCSLLAGLLEIRSADISESHAEAWVQR